ncbi:hypothetical protein MMC07_002386 [Pseudocyphellaria aurata]|nr:hypothetical protein [Pseudocyphellaria aurata]
MNRGFSTKRPTFSQRWICCQSPSLQQRRLRKTQVELASSAQLRTLLDEVDQPEVEERRIQDEDTELSQDLPKSPLMDSKLVSAREHYMRRKQRPNREYPSDLEEKLSMNPYAQALASPLRHCGLTGVRLPKELLLDFGIVNHPKTGLPWHFPVLAGLFSQNQLLETVIDSASPVSRSSPLEGDSPPPPAQTFAPKESPQEPATGIAPSSDMHERKYSSPPSKALFCNFSRFQKGNYFLSSYRVINFLSKAQKGLIFRVLSLRWKSGNEPALRQTIWRRDMHIFILDLLRKDALEKLRTPATQYKSHLLEDISDVPLGFVSAALWLGKSEGHVPEATTLHNREMVLDNGKAAGNRLEHGDLSTSREESNSTGPPHYAMMSRPTGCYIPVYNLRVLMGAERLQELRSMARIFGCETVYLRQRRKTLRLQMALWKLMGYMNSVGEGEWKRPRGQEGTMWTETNSEPEMREAKEKVMGRGRKYEKKLKLDGGVNE